MQIYLTILEQKITTNTLAKFDNVKVVRTNDRV